MAIVLSNTGPLIALGKLNRLHLLSELFDQVQIPLAVYDEVVTQGLVRGAPEALTVRLFWQRHQWPIVDVPESLLSSYVPPVILDPGETEVLALAQSLPDPLVLLDDEVARAEARRLGLGVCGTLGILAGPIEQACFLLIRLNCSSTKSPRARTSGSRPGFVSKCWRHFRCRRDHEGQV